MHKSFKIVAIIPARGGSKGIPRKNIRLLGRKPLIAYSIEAAKKSKLVQRVIVTTDDKEIAEVAKKYGAEVPFMRPLELAQDKTPMGPVLTHVVDFLEKEESYYPDLIVLLQPTSPLRSTQHIDEAIDKFLQDKVDSLVSIEIFNNNRHEIDKYKRLIPTFTKTENRDKRAPIVMENGAIYISDIKLIKQGKILGNKIGFYEMNHYSSIDIDEPVDFIVAEQMMKMLKKYKL